MLVSNYENILGGLKGWIQEWGSNILIKSFSNFWLASFFFNIIILPQYLGLGLGWIPKTHTQTQMAEYFEYN